MLNTYIKNRGSTTTLMYNNKRNNINEINWDADYDGKVANISVDLQDNGKHKRYDVTLDNNDLANILNIPSVNTPLERRLKKDFKCSKTKHTPNLYKLEVEDLYQPHSMQVATNPENDQTVEKLLEKVRKMPPHISSPLSNEEFIIPLTLDNNSYDTYTLTPKGRQNIRTHKKRKVYKKVKSRAISKKRIKPRKMKSVKGRFPFF